MGVGLGCVLASGPGLGYCGLVCDLQDSFNHLLVILKARHINNFDRIFKLL